MPADTVKIAARFRGNLKVQHGCQIMFWFYNTTKEEEMHE